MRPRTYRSFSLGVGLLAAAVLAIGTCKISGSRMIPREDWNAC
jgi:hypothetical protein